MSLKEVVRLSWKRIVCLYLDHDMAALVRWSPEAICLHVVCSRCGKALGHIDVPSASKRTTEKEKMH